VIDDELGANSTIKSSRRSVLLSLAAASLSQVIPSGPGWAGPLGEFKGRVVAEWLPDGRRMKLLEPFEYIDPAGKSWPVPTNTIVDGASIPSVFWSIIGGPFEGLYRGPSVVHDFYCQMRTRKYPEVHQTFHDAMLTAGVSTKKAWIMYKAVAQFGPQWPDPKADPACEVTNENFDFEKCARGTATRSLAEPATKEELLQFSREVASEADPADVEKLRVAIDKMN
jgi:hypothetical protein